MTGAAYAAPVFFGIVGAALAAARGRGQAPPLQALDIRQEGYGAGETTSVSPSDHSW